MGSILLVNSEKNIYGNVQQKMIAKGYKCFICDGVNAAEMLEKTAAELVILYSNEQKKDIRLLTRLRTVKYDVLMIVIGKMNRVEDKIQWLDNGACDCVDVSISEGEVLARIHAALRRCHSNKDYGNEILYQEKRRFE
jgi:DNA-binding response OmpR family regulator